MAERSARIHPAVSSASLPCRCTTFLLVTSSNAYGFRFVSKTAPDGSSRNSAVGSTECSSSNCASLSGVSRKYRTGQFSRCRLRDALPPVMSRVLVFR